MSTGTGALATAFAFVAFLAFVALTGGSAAGSSSSSFSVETFAALGAFTTFEALFFPGFLGVGA